MKKLYGAPAHLRENKGIVAVYVALGLVVFIGFTALAVDVGYVMVTKNELQNIADGAALAGARTLGRLYECDGDIVTCPRPMPYEDQLKYSPDEEIIKNAIRDVASKNRAGGMTGITILDDGIDIVIGNWVHKDPLDLNSKMINSPSPTSPDAVSVTARRDASANSPISTFFARIWKINTMNVSATATAALTGESTSAPGGLPLPAAINKSWVEDPANCEKDLTFHPSSTNTCSAWHAYTGDVYKPTGSVANGMPPLLNDLAALTYSSPETIAGQIKYDFTNGTLATVFEHTPGYIQNLFNVMKVKNDGILDMDKDPATWTLSVPVFDDTKEGCRPSGPITIVGFATIIITGVDPPPASTIFATLKCDNVVAGRGSGGNFGTKGSIPGLVQ